MEKTVNEAFSCYSPSPSVVGLVLILIILKWFIILHFQSNLRYALVHLLVAFLCDIMQISFWSKTIQRSCIDKKVGDHDTTSKELIRNPTSSSQVPIPEAISCLNENVVDDKKHLCIGELEIVMEKLGALSYDADGGEVVEGRLGSTEIADLFEEEPPSLEEVKEAFHVFDENKDGFIDAGEISKVLCALGFVEASQVENCKRMIKAFDSNGDGRIDFGEFVILLENSLLC